MGTLWFAHLCWSRVWGDIFQVLCVCIFQYYVYILVLYYIPGSTCMYIPGSMCMCIQGSIIAGDRSWRVQGYRVAEGWLHTELRCVLRVCVAHSHSPHLLH